MLVYPYYVFYYIGATGRIEFTTKQLPTDPESRLERSHHSHDYDQRYPHVHGKLRLLLLLHRLHLNMRWAHGAVTAAALQVCCLYSQSYVLLIPLAELSPPLSS